MRNNNCIICDTKTFLAERIHAADFNKRGHDVPLCSTCENDAYKYMMAVTFSKAMWKNTGSC